MQGDIQKLNDVVIVGGGLSGLTAAYHLLSTAPDIQLLVLEAKDRLGGRTLTTPLKSPKGTDMFDLGGQWVSSAQPHIMQLLLELGLSSYPQYLAGTKFMQLGDKTIRSYNGEIPSLPWLSLLDLQWFILKFNNLCKNVDVRNPSDHSGSAELDSMTVQTYIDKNVYTKATKEAINVAVRTTFGVEPSAISLLFMLFFAKSAGGMMKLFEASKDGAQEQRVKGGTQQISERLADKIGLEKIKLSSPVNSIHQISDDKDGYFVKLILENGDVVIAKYVIMAIPLQIAAEIHYDPPLSEKRKLLLQNMPMAHMGKFIITYSKAFWREKGFSGEIVSNGGRKIADDCDSGPLGVVYDNTSFSGAPALVGFLVGDQGTQWCSKPYEIRKLAILKQLAEFFGDEALDPLEYAEKFWSQEPYNGGCPTNIGTPGIMQYVSDNLRSPMGRIYWAGTETATEWPGYMNGAVQAGRRAAKEVLFTLRPMSLTTKDLYDSIYKQVESREQKRNDSQNKTGWLYFAASIILGLLALFYMFQLVE